jgi:hypothetical protein
MAKKKSRKPYSDTRKSLTKFRKFKKMIGSNGIKAARVYLKSQPTILQYHRAKVTELEKLHPALVAKESN